MYLLAPRETVKGKVLHITRFLACQNELRQPLSHNRRELKAVLTDRKVLFEVDVLTIIPYVTHLGLVRLRKRGGEEPAHSGLKQTLPLSNSSPIVF
jgi:hypothetical protein